MEKCFGEVVVGKCCGNLLKSAMVVAGIEKKCCGEMLWWSHVEKCCREVLW